MTAAVSEKAPPANEDMANEDLSFYPPPDYRRRLNSEAAPQPLPDLLLHASPRRTRSASINLPASGLVMRNIGLSLRRLSDDFAARVPEPQQPNGRASPNDDPPKFKLFKKH